MLWTNHSNSISNMTVAVIVSVPMQLHWNTKCRTRMSNFRAQLNLKPCQATPSSETGAVRLETGVFKTRYPPSSSWHTKNSPETATPRWERSWTSSTRTYQTKFSETWWKTRSFLRWRRETCTMYLGVLVFWGRAPWRTRRSTSWGRGKWELGRNIWRYRTTRNWRTTCDEIWNCF